MKKQILTIIFIVMGVALATLYVDNYLLKKSLESQIELAYQDGYKDGTFTVTKADEDIKKLKRENRELYDSIKSYKEKVSFLAQFKYQKVYVTDTVYIKPIEPKDSIVAYEYGNEDKTDSLNYTLTIGSVVEPNWYKLKIDVNDKFTIINKKDDGTNQTTITSGNGGLIDDVTVFNRKEKKPFWKRFSAGPSVGVGYGMLKHNYDIYVGFNVTYDLKKQ